MNCVGVRKSLVEYAEGVLASRKKLKVELHLSQCESCRSELEQIRKLREEILSLGQPELEEEFWENFNRKLSQRLQNELESPSRRPSWVPKLAIAGATAALILLSLFAFIRLRELPKPAREVASHIGAMESDNSSASVEPATLLEDADDETMLALADLSNEDIEDVAGDADSFMEEDFQSISDDVVLDGMYEQGIYDMLEGLTPDEYAEVYQGLESI